MRGIDPETRWQCMQSLADCENAIILEPVLAESPTAASGSEASKIHSGGSHSVRQEQHKGDQLGKQSRLTEIEPPMRIRKK
jgi:hypothetical protein